MKDGRTCEDGRRNMKHMKEMKGRKERKEGPFLLTSPSSPSSGGGERREEVRNK
jgi:hypothetical protein